MGKEVVTCGIFIYSIPIKKILVVQSTGNKLFSIPKGHYEETDLEYLTAAIREVKEETDFVFKPDSDFVNLGMQKYLNKNKFLVSWLYFCQEDLTDYPFKCNSFFEQIKTKQMLLEISDFKLMTLEEASLVLHYTQTKTIPLIQLITNKI